MHNKKHTMLLTYYLRRSHPGRIYVRVYERAIKNICRSGKMVLLQQQTNKQAKNKLSEHFIKKSIESLKIPQNGKIYISSEKVGE